MKKLYFLGAAANYSRKERLAHTFSIGLKSDCEDLTDFLEKKYEGRAMLTKNGRSALALALRVNLEKGSRVIVNGFTCYAVYEAVKAAGMEPVFADIDKKTLNFTVETIKDLKADGIIIQNTLGNVVDIKAIEKWAEENDVKIIEDLAHCTGVKYADGREAGTVGVATALSFGKDKSIDTISGGAVIFRDKMPKIAAPRLKPRRSDALRERFYPMFGAMSRGLAHIHAGGAFMKFLVLIHWVQKSADNKLEMNRKISKFEARRALRQLELLDKEGEGTIRDFYLVEKRDELLKELAEAGYYFEGFWYEKPVSPERYYEKVGFPEDSCPVAVEVASKIINVPKFYSEEELAPAMDIIKKYVEKA
ncbi:DegT/DnrJ/EryC1/StrS family aminotransferase [Candidatus Saccharibacteria bacterium]|nr:DegT/DnrJ/EryC1/StrS family aminotransferase [Candidatus Saccharibacteria bacterium]